MPSLLILAAEQRGEKCSEAALLAASRRHVLVRRLGYRLGAHRLVALHLRGGAALHLRSQRGAAAQTLVVGGEPLRLERPLLLLVCALVACANTR